MRCFRPALVVVALLVTLSAAACGAGEEGPPAAVDESAPAPIAESPADETAAAREASEEAEATLISELPWEDFDRNAFDRPTVIDNEWFPLRPGSQLVYEGVTEEGGVETAHRVLFTVTDLTKMIAGVRTVVAWDQDYSEGELVETELAFFAQDNDGNVWHFGQYPEEYEKGTFVEAPAWIHGVEDARAGISMKAIPDPDGGSYSQGWGPEVDWTDRAQVFATTQETCVPAGCYDDVLIMDEFSQEEPGAFQQKYYAPGVGNVQVGWRGDDPNKETLELVELVTLTEEEMAEARAAVLALEESAYERSPEVYGRTLPLEHTPSGDAEPQEDDQADDASDTESAEQPFEDFDYENFDDPTTIDNEWLPLQPGTQWVYEGVTVEDGEEIPHRVVITVTDLTKLIDGVRSVVTWDLDFSDGELVEAELAFFAQDNDGNVWRMGEYPEEYEEGEFVDAPAWIAGLEDAKAGIAMLAEPKLGTPSYSQGWAPEVEFTDRGQVDQVGQSTCVPLDCYENVLVIAESSLEEPNAFQLKSFARGVGNIEVGSRGEDPSMESLGLVEIVQLDAKALKEVRAEALRLEAHAYEVSEDVYGQTPALE